MGAADYQNAMTGGGKYTLRAVMHAKAFPSDPNRTGETVPPGSGSEIVMNIFRENAFYEYSGARKAITTIKGTFVHEQGHVWDFASGGDMSTGLARSVNGRFELNTGTGQKRYVTDGQPPTDAGVNPTEDWAETVMALTYPTHRRSQGPVSAWSDGRKNFVRGVAPGARIP